MSFFQQSVLNKYTKQLDEKAVAEAYSKFKAYFHNAAIQANIRDAKEEQFQEGFLRELFVKILGYTINPEPEYNLTTELKNETGAKKADGAIIKDTKAVGVIELKGTDTTDLNKITEQAFHYKHNQANCVYVVTSNFEKLRFFIHNAIEHVEFNLFTLSETDFRLLWLCLQKENVFNDIPKKIKEESNSAEEKITKQLYADYSVFKNELWQNLVSKNPLHDKLLLYQKSQKLLDRFLFIFFAEDKGLLPPNSLNEIIKQWEELKERDAYFPLYERLKKYFGYMNTGHKFKENEIFAYNGGLFQTDELLDAVKIDDEILKKHTLQLASYDFASEVDVNILGHIFEHSLSEIEAITAELEGRENDKSKSKRKKDGVFYTPKYITKYIVENTVGKTCEEKKTEFGIIEEEFAKGRKNRKKETIKALDNQLKQYRNWLLGITICDPACGSGAFLNQALDFLIKEHQYIDELQSALLGGSIVFPDIENHILENNIYGVDINEESVEIAKLSLWLRTAQKGRKLTSLNSNIKCGNSLIDDETVAGAKAFNWYAEFPQVFPAYIHKKAVEAAKRKSQEDAQDYLIGLAEPPPYSYNEGSKGFEKHGFDVVIGNPPYVFARDNFRQEEKDFYVSKYVSAKYQINTYLLFIERSVRLLKEKGSYGLIVPNSWLMMYSGEGLRKFLLDNCKLNQIINLEGYSFESANVETVILIAEKNKIENDITVDILLNNGTEFYLFHSKSQLEFAKNKGYEFKVFLDDENNDLNSKIIANTEILDNLTCIKAGLQAYEKDKGEPKQTGEDVINRPYDFNYRFDEDTHKYLDGKDVGRYFISWSGLYLRYGNHLAAPRTFNLFDSKKIIVREITGIFPKCLIATYSEDVYLYNRSNIAILEKEKSGISLKYIIALLNSTLMSYYFVKNTAKSVRKLFPKIILNDLRKFPIKKISISEQQPFIEKADLMLSLNKELQKSTSQFLNLLQSKFKIEKLSIKLQNWYELEFSNFLKELKKAKLSLSLTEEAQWMQYFNDEKQKALKLQKEIENTDKEIDKMVYKLYELTSEEIKIVEGK